MKFPKKTTATLLTATLLLGNLNVLNFDNLSNKIVYAEENPANTALSNVDNNTFNDDDSVKVIVKLKESEVNPNTLKTEEGRKEREKSTKEPREKALKEIKKQGIEYKVLFEYDTLLNGFALETSYKDAQKIQALDFVESVEVSVDFEAPETPATAENADEKLRDTVIDSNRIIGVQGLWDKGYKGQGRVVSVIDSGLDPDHDILHLTDSSQAKYKNKEELETVKNNAGIDYGKWYSDKLIYAFNYYDWDNNLKEKKDKSHGMHVVGTAVGNPTKKAPNEEYVRGVAPESQLIFMRVFSDKQGGTKTSTFLYVKAIEDSVKLGADSINMSLGATAGAVTEVGQGTLDAIALAKKAGVNVIVAAGNDNVFGNGQSKPRATNPDYGLVGTPSVAADSIAVAALNNSVMNSEVLTIPQLAGNEEWDNGEATIRPYTKKFDPNVEYSYVNAGYGLESDFKNIDVKGKVAVMMRGGGNTFADKVAVAKKAGATGAVLYNDAKGGEELLNVALNNLDKDFPVVTVGYKYGYLLASYPDYYTVKFTGHFAKRKHPQANQLADFTSWGMTGDGMFKPDVTAPGGDVYSSFNNGTYGLDSGTSMASPHVAGAVSLLKQVFQNEYSSLGDEEIGKLIKHLLMSTAIPNYNEETKAYTSPRQQGAGVIDVTKAAEGKLYATGDNDYGSISLGNVGDTFNFNVTLHNLADEPKELVYKTYLNTDGVENGEITLKPRQLAEISGGETVTVPAKGEKTITISVDATQFKNELEGLMPNGYYLEGFVRFFDAKDNNTVVAGIPYVGFKGEFQNLPVVEKPIYDFKGDEKPFYYYKPKTTERDEKNNFTSIITVDVTGEQKDLKVLGEYTDPKTKSNYFGKLAFSPNGDRQHDEIGFKGMFLRNYENLKLTVYAKDDVERKNPLYEKGNVSGKKNFFHNKSTNKKAVLISETTWKGQDKNDNPLPDGEYQYVVSYSPVATGSNMQETAFNVIIDRVAPKIVGTGGVYDEKTRTFTPYQVKEEGSGLLYKKLSYKVSKKDKTGKTVEEEVVVDENIDGTYTLPAKVSLDKFTFEVGDYAGNKDSVGISKVQNTEKGTLEIKSTTKDGTGNYATNVRYAIKNEKGEVVGEDFTKNGKNLQALPFGKYTVEVVLADEALKLVSDKKVEFELTKDDATKEVVFTSEEQKRNTTIIKFDKVVPDGAKVIAVSEDGTATEIPRSPYAKEKEFQKRLVNGKYTIKVELPEGYSSSENNFELNVENGRNTKELALNVAQKVSTITTAENSPVTATVSFDEAKLYSDYRLVVTEVDKESQQRILEKIQNEPNISNYEAVFYNIHIVDRDGKVVEVEGPRTVNMDTDKTIKKFAHETKDGSLEAVNAQYKDGKFTFIVNSFSNFVGLVEKDTPQETPKTIDKSALQTLVDAQTNVTEKEEYEYATLDAKQEYNTAINAGRQLLEDETSTQEEIDAAVAKINAALKNLTGKKPQDNTKEVDKTNLRKALEKSKEVVKTPKYINSDAERKAEYDNAVAGAETVLGNDDADENRINNILENLKQAEERLNGKDKEDKKEEPKQENTVNKKELSAVVDKYADVIAKEEFNSANDSDKENYKTLIAKAVEVLANAQVSQEEVDNTLKALKEAEEKFTAKKSGIISKIFGKKDKQDQTQSYSLGDVAHDKGVSNTDKSQFGSVDSKGKSTSILAKTGTTTVSTLLLGLLILGLAVLLRKKVK